MTYRYASNVKITFFDNDPNYCFMSTKPIVTYVNIILVKFRLQAFLMKISQEKGSERH